MGVFTLVLIVDIPGHARFYEHGLMIENTIPASQAKVHMNYSSILSVIVWLEAIATQVEIYRSSVVYR